jgi:hypothetical protein
MPDARKNTNGNMAMMPMSPNTGRVSSNVHHRTTCSREPALDDGHAKGHHKLAFAMDAREMP